MKYYWTFDGISKIFGKNVQQKIWLGLGRLSQRYHAQLLFLYNVEKRFLVKYIGIYTTSNDNSILQQKQKDIRSCWKQPLCLFSGPCFAVLKWSCRVNWIFWLEDKWLNLLDKESPLFNNRPWNGKSELHHFDIQMYGKGQCWTALLSCLYTPRKSCFLCINLVFQYFKIVLLLKD